MKANTHTGSLLKCTALAALAALMALSPIQQSFAQTAFNTRSFGSEIQVNGTSNLHDWSMKGSGLSCEAQFTVNSASVLQLLTLNGLNFSMPVTNLKSGESLLNTRAYKAMNAEKYSHINFKMSSATISPQGNNRYIIKANGQLTISGVTREVSLQASSSILADHTVVITGSKKIKMSEFGIKPPSFMLGALRTGDEVTIDFNLKFNEPKQLTAKN